nr:hypothetical protein BaRGS_031917 [Batillaria attramentaria]
MATSFLSLALESAFPAIQILRVLASSHVRPESRSSQCKLLLQICLGRALFLFPCGFHSNACLVMLQGREFHNFGAAFLKDRAPCLFLLVSSVEGSRRRRELADRKLRAGCVMTRVCFFLFICYCTIIIILIRVNFVITDA